MMIRAASPDIVAQRLVLRPLSAAVVAAAARGRILAASRAFGVQLPAGWPGDAKASFQMHARRLQERADWPAWSLHAVLSRENGRVVGHADYHGPPGFNALGDEEAVEISYTIESEFRGQGYAQEAARALVIEAFRRGVPRVLASIAPENAASRAVASRLGFRFVRTTHRDDGIEDVYEIRPTSDIR